MQYRSILLVVLALVTPYGGALSAAERQPNIDRLAREGMRFTDAHAGGCDSAPANA